LFSSSGDAAEALDAKMKTGKSGLSFSNVFSSKVEPFELKTTQDARFTLKTIGSSLQVDRASEKGKCVRCWVRFCQLVAGSPYFTALTTLLTFYALFGDDMRLLFTDKPADQIFDIVTIATMAIFFLEVVVCSVGKAGYLFGFFFFLDMVSTVTLVLDITWVAEELFGDSISKDSNAQESSGGGSTGGDSAQAARAARMSRAGTKAGRVVRLIRLMRLIRLFKIFRNPKSMMTQEFWIEPGGDFEDDDVVQNADQESAVSKKLSEMTTRRVIMLVLSIMLTLPFFQADMYKDFLSTSAQYGINSLYRSFRDDMQHFNPTSDSQARSRYMQSVERANYENDFRLYAYFHNWFCEDIPDGKANSPMTSFGKLFWVGGSPTDSAEAEFFLPLSMNSPVENLNPTWNGEDWVLYLCDLPQAAQSALQSPWTETSDCLNGKIRGVSLIESQDPRAKCPSDLRFQERVIASPIVMSREESLGFVFMFVFDRREGSRMEAALNFGQTIFICLLLGIGAMTFSKDANSLVLAPIERMISKLEAIRANPISAMTLGEEDASKEQIEAYRKSVVNGEKIKLGGLDSTTFSNVPSIPTSPTIFRRFLKWISSFQSRCCDNVKESEPEPMETVVLEKTIIKIGSLLALGFGEAGAEIIGQNMKGEKAAVNAMIPGRKVNAIFGFCSIRNFSDAAEVLEDQIMVFVNRIAQIVHASVHEFFGNPNQNAGDAFLIVWRLSDQLEEKQRRLADMSIVSFMKIVAKISKSPTLSEYRTHTRLVKRLPNYRVRLGFGLHSGWAIEGAIGSEFKIDAAYLSTNVVMATRLEGLTKTYGVSIVISDAVTNLMTTPFANLCRQVDQVAWTDSPKPLKLYSLDLDDLGLDIDERMTEPRTKREKFRRKFDRQRRKMQRWSADFIMYDLIRHDEDINLMRAKYSTDFLTRFNDAYLKYEAGDWEAAQPMLEATRFLSMVEDGPSVALLRFLKSHDYKAPETWPGYRFLPDA